MQDVQRISHHIRLALNGTDPKGTALCDIGGGVGAFSPSCAALGMNVLLVDDFADPVNTALGDDVLAVHRKFGVRVLSRDVVAVGLADIAEKFDFITSFDSMEHWHNSPKSLLHQIQKSLLKDGGRFVLGVPNCVNLRKRITVPIGIGKWSSMHDWYENGRFRGHVREPDVSDLWYIARDMRLKDARVTGRNWLGYRSRFAFARAVTPIVDIALRPFPSLCSDIYLTGNI